MQLRRLVKLVIYSLLIEIKLSKTLSKLNKTKDFIVVFVIKVLMILCLC